MPPILDYDDELSYTAGPPATSKQSVIGAAGVAIVSGKVKDAGAARDWGSGEPIVPYVRTVDALAGAGCTGVTVDIVGADNAALTTNPVVLATVTILVAAFLANKLIAMPPLTPGVNKRYVGAKFTPNGAASTAGSLVCGFIGRDGRPQDGVNNL